MHSNPNLIARSLTLGVALLPVACLGFQSAGVSTAMSKSKSSAVHTIGRGMEHGGQSLSLSRHDIDRIAAGIYRTEGSSKTKYPYGIKLANRKGQSGYRHFSTTEARIICERTIINAWRDYILQDYSPSLGEFIPFLSNRYCPPSVDRVGNARWQKNMQSICLVPKENQTKAKSTGLTRGEQNKKQTKTKTNK